MPARSRVAGGPTKQVPVYFWYLDSSSDTVETTPPYIQSFNRMRDPNTTEAVINVHDGRKKVAQEHFEKVDGKYRGIVKLFLLYEKQASQLADNESAWPIATGWLVKEDVVVTAGHCGFDHSHGLGRLVKARAYIGYKGHDDLENTEAQWGTAVATTPDWINGVGSEPADISFIKLSSPFTTVASSSLFTWAETPVSQDAADLGVVGYPGDIMNDGERGARMYEMFASTTYNLTDSDRHMLQYKIDTYGGNSGSPVFNNRLSLVAIGVHVLGGYSYNSASVFDGQWGNCFSALRMTAEALTVEGHRHSDSSHPDATKSWLWVTQNRTQAHVDQATQMLIVSTREAQKVVDDIPSDMLYAKPSVLSFGPDVGPEISILAATAIATAGRLAADSRSGAHAEALADTRPYDGIVGRALLAEAALQFYAGNALRASDKDKMAEFTAPVAAGLAPFVLKVAPRLLKGMLEPSFRLLLSRINNRTTPRRVRTWRNPTAELDTGFGRALEGQELAFLDTLMADVAADEATVESFFSCMTTVGDFIGNAFKKAGPVLADVAKIGLPLLLGTEAADGGAAAAASPTPTPTPTPTYLDPLEHRAIVAEACLQSCIQLHTELELGKKGLFKKLLDAVKILGPKIVNVAPYAAKLVGPIVGDILRELEEKKKKEEKRLEFLDFSWG